MNMRIMNNADMAGVLNQSFVADNPPLIVIQEWQYIVTSASLVKPEWIDALPLLTEIIVPVDELEKNVYLRTPRGGRKSTDTGTQDPVRLAVTV
jgi:hypothetical protein